MLGWLRGIRKGRLRMIRGKKGGGRNIRRGGIRAHPVEQIDHP